MNKKKVAAVLSGGGVKAEFGLKPKEKEVEVEALCAGVCSLWNYCSEGAGVYHAFVEELRQERELEHMQMQMAMENGAGAKARARVKAQVSDTETEGEDEDENEGKSRDSDEEDEEDEE